ncbi:hypothetical protein ASPZODRAFT_15492 [Penicilliopsis zonata CBS 506.65]|uniref:Lysine-specific metallo-endopeptidase domain-containing protein n=1 Tax=Penicilliopsis zonata CBS 506.65 TaxID=1073090 RepID=A0A1L9SLW7_9EURO|nr:hypothetical protein ASPZODRAFT_15492 [Penicilliopsis zonata CBS 506.65]OJJ48047.1 hypothetical protein ASPZODRAFT_15492 [Penicilliopsis zonata CBS 506.65]
MLTRTPLLTLAAVAQAVIIEYRFDLLTGAGSCSDDYVTNLDSYLEDTGTLITSFKDAMTAALKADDGGTAGRDGYVARRLFTSWFGIQFTNALKETPAPTSETKAIWTQMEAAVDNVYDFLVGSGMTGPGLTDDLPWLACSGEFAQRYDWDASAFAEDGEEIDIDDEIQSINEIFPESDSTVPYWMSEKKAYEMLEDYYADNLCDAFTLNGKQDTLAGLTFPGATAYSTTVLGSAVKYLAKAPGILLCPRVFSTTTNKINVLSDITYQDPDSKAEISTIIPQGSATLLHEIFHLVNYWTEKTGATDASDVVVSSAKVVDISYDARKCLQLAQGSLASYQAIDSTINSQSYIFFVLSYWYYQQSFLVADTTDQYEVPGTFYMGYVVKWNWKE